MVDQATVEGPTAAAPATRFAVLGDLPSIEDLDVLAFGDASAEAASGEELRLGIEDNSMVVAFDSATEEIVGYAQWAYEPASSVAFVCGVAVAPTHRRVGVASILVDRLLLEVKTRHNGAVVEATTAPSNIAMLRLLLGRGFVGVSYVDDYYGPNKPRIYLRRARVFPRFEETSRLIVPATSDLAVRDLMLTRRFLMRAIVAMPHGLQFEFASESFESAALKANEATASVTFTGILFTAIAFLTGFALVTTRFPTDLLAVLVLSLVVLAFALIVYANSTGALSRLDSEDFEEYMRVGNLLSEFGGVYPFFHVMPVVLVSLAHQQRVIGGLTCLGSSIVLALYHSSRFEILERYLQHKTLRRVVEAFLTASPVAGYALHQWTGSTWPWSALDVSVLAILIGVCMRIREASPI